MADERAFADLFAGGGEMGALMRTTDWSKTRLGPVDAWPSSLKTMLGVVLGSRFPMLLWWGPDLLHLYNDAYRPILRDKHPASLAAPAAEIWAEIWDVAGPLARGVMEGGPATWIEDLQLFINSGTMAEETYFTFSYSPVPGDDGRVGGLLNIVQETTAKVQSERQIGMLQDLMARASEAKSEAEAYRIVVDVLSANKLDLPFLALYALHENDDARLVGASGWKQDDGRAPWPFAEVVRTGQAVVVEDPARAIVLPLSRGFLVAGLSPHRALDDRYRRFFRTTADQVASVIAKVRAFETETKRAEALAEIDRAKTTFFSNVSHEFRTPLTLILGPVEDALALSAPVLQGDSLKTVHRSALRLLRLVNSLLDFARLEAGRVHMAFVPTDLAGLTADLASSFRSLIERAGLKLVVDCPPIAEPVYVDATQWEKITLNLISNAFKFTLRGEIAVGLRSHRDHVTLTVRDTGTGIPTHELPRIFERFHRVEGATGRSFEGTGIGLSLVEELVKLHGGSVRVSSVEGQGSTFEVSLPTGSAHLPAGRIAAGAAAPTAAGAAPYVLEAARWIGPDAEIEAAPLPMGPMASPGRERARVLVVDDNADMREYLARLLSARWRVDAVDDGEAALASARSQPPDLVLSDVMMPGLDGFGLLRELRADPRTSQVPVVLLSARAGEEALLEGLETGADDYLVKPFAARELLARVQTHLDLARLRREWSQELERANNELEAFSYSVSHDLRAPLRAIDGFSKALLDDYADKLDAQGVQYLERVRAATQRMAQLIDDLLGLSQITRAPLKRQRVDMTDLARHVLGELSARDPGRTIATDVADGLVVQVDPRLLTVMLENLLGNAWKFTSKQPAATIEVGTATRDGEAVYFVRDNGAGFSMEHATKLFAPFQRLHDATEFEGTGIGLATVNRVVARHGGRVWAEAKPGQGATFLFTLGAQA
jgi:signal transduction histidine kinase